MRSHSLVALSFLVAGGCSLGTIGLHDEADTVSSDLVISQVYGGGGNAGSTYKNDFVVVFNRGAAAVNLNGISLWYETASSDGVTGTPWGSSTALATTDFMLAPGQSFLVEEKAGTSSTGGSTALPTPDATGTIALSGTDGQVALAVSKPSNMASSWIDLVGYGNAVLFEGAAAPGPTTNTTADARKDACVDTGDNFADFAKLTAAPINSTATPTPCTPTDGGTGADLDVDMTKPADMVVTSTGAGTVLLNEIKLHPASKPTQNGQEFIELEGSGQIPVHTFVVAVSGDTGNPKGSTAGKIDYVFDVSAQSFTSTTAAAPSLMLIKATGTTFAGVASDTVVLDDANLDTARLGDYTESVLLVTVPDLVSNPLTVGGNFPTATGAYTIIDSIAVLTAPAADMAVDPTFGAAVLPACKSDGTAKLYPPSAVSRIVGNTTAQSTAPWYGGQYEKGELSTDQYLGNVADCSGASGAPQVWVLTPGAPNSPTTFPDLAQPIVDLAGSTADFATAADDLATNGADDLGVDVFDLAHRTDGGTVIPGGRIGSGGCSVGGKGGFGWTSALLLVGLAAALRRRRAA